MKHEKEGHMKRGNKITHGGAMDHHNRGRFEHGDNAGNGGSKLRNSALEGEMRKYTMGSHLSAEGDDY